MTTRNRHPMRFNGGNWSSTHTYGSCLVNHARKLYFIEIPKCASSWARAYLGQVGETYPPISIWEAGNFLTDLILDTYRPIVFLRNPIERWISSDPVADKILSFSQSEFQLLFEKLVNRSLLPDEHTCPQIEFLRGVDLSDAYFFRVGPELASTFQRFLIEYGFKAKNAPRYINQREKSNDITEREHIWRTAFKNPEWFYLFQLYVAEDYNLFRWATFKE